MFGHGDAIWFSDGNGKPAAPPNGVAGLRRHPRRRHRRQIENPNPAAGTNNWYTEDGYGALQLRLSAAVLGSPASGGGSYSDCSDPSQPGVKPVRGLPAVAASPDRSALRARPLLSAEQLQPGLVRQRQERLHRPQSVQHAVHHSAVVDAAASATRLNDKNISWKYYGDQWNNYVNDPYQLNYGAAGPTADEYCNICNPFQYDTSIMAHPDQVAEHIQDTTNLYADISERTRCRRSRSSSRAASSTATRRRRSSICSKASPRRSSIRSQASPYAQGHRHLHHLRRRRRLLRLGLRAAARLLRRRHPHPADRGFAVREAGPYLARLRRSRLDPQVHRAQLAAADRSRTAAATTSRTRSPSPTIPTFP